MSPSAIGGKYVGGDTIAALSSRWGRANRAVIRLSGPDAITLTERVFIPAGQSLEQSQGHTVLGGWLRLGEQVKCPCQVYLFRGPHSYSGEDLIEYHLPGGPAVVQMAMAELTAAGARLAEPGEFSLRAFLEGKMDLTQAEAVAAIISSQTDAQLRAANSLADGALSEAVGRIQNTLAELVANVEANIDFVDQNIDFVCSEQAAAAVSKMQGQLDEVLQGAVRQRELDAQPRVVLAGWANVGKSTLLNVLSGLSRAIVSGVAGTTRDVLMAPMKEEATRGHNENVLLMDAAGLCGSSLDEVGQAAREAAIEAVRRADLVLYAVDAAAGINESQWQTLDMLRPGRTVIVVNKIDLLSKDDLRQRRQEIQQERKESVVMASAKSGQGLAALRKQITEQLKDIETPIGQGRVVLTGRAEEGIKQAKAALERVNDLLEANERIENPELLAVELYEANAALGAITGELTSEDVLEDIFGRFCVGK